MSGNDFPSNADHDQLENVAYEIADKYRDDQLPGLTPGRDRSKDWEFMTSELKRRCPGFSDEEYSKALNDGFVSSR